MPSDRRRFLTQAACIGGTVLVGGGGTLAVSVAGRSRKRRKMQAGMLGSAHPVLSALEQRERGQVPRDAQESIRLFFHGACLDTAEFVDEICSVSFVERLHRSTTAEEQQESIAAVFHRTIVMPEEVVFRVNQIADDVGHEMDQNWKTCCEEVAQGWKTDAAQFGKSPSAGILVQHTEGLMREQLAEAIGTASRIAAKPAISEIAASIGQEALRALPIVRLNRSLGTFVFVVRALWNVGPRLIELLQHRPGDYQRQISTQLAQLGNRLGLEYSGAVKARVAALHDWRQQAVAMYVDEHVKASIPLLG